MKGIAVFALALLAPVVMFAQVPPDRGTLALKRMGLTDDQVAKVGAIVKDTETKIKDDRIHLGLLKAQIRDGILPSTARPDMAAIDKLVDQESQLRGDMEKALLSAEVQLIQIMGRDNFERYFRLLKAELGMRAGKNTRTVQAQSMGRGMYMMPGAAPFAWRNYGAPLADPKGSQPAPNGSSN